MKKATDEQLYTAYSALKSCKKVGENFGMCPQSVHERIKRMGISRKINTLTEEEKEKIESLYRDGFKRGDGKVKNLSLELNRTPQFIARYAKKLELTNSSRLVDETIKENISSHNKEWLKNNPHPKGMKGKTHSDSMREEMSIRVKKRYKELQPEEKSSQYSKMVNTSREKGAYNRKHGSWSSGWRTIGDKKKFFRSTWEANYARYLEFLKQNGSIREWEYEPQTFWFLKIMRGSRSYLPDFKVTNLDGTHYWVEVKGWMDKRSKTKIKRFAKYYPSEKLVLIQSNWFKENLPTLKGLLKGWE